MRILVLTLCITIAVATAHPAEYNLKNPAHSLYVAPLHKATHSMDSGHQAAGASGTFAGADGKVAPEAMSATYGGDVGGSAGSEGLSVTYGGDQGGEVKTA